MKAPQSFLSKWTQAFRERAAAGGVSRGAMLTGMLMASYANADGTSITVSQQTLGDRQGVTTRSVRRDQKQLEAGGWIHLERRGLGPRDPNRYRLNVPSLDTPDRGDSVRGNLVRDATAGYGTAEARTTDTGSTTSGHQRPTTMGNHGTIRTTPEGVVERQRLLRASDLPPLTPLERAIIARRAELGMEV